MSEGNEVAVSFSGWLPGEAKNGLGRTAKAQFEAFNTAWDADDDTTAATLQLVIGLTEVVDTKKRKHREDKPPVVATRFVHVEVVPAELQETLRSILHKIHADRTGNEPLPGMSGSSDDDDEGGEEHASTSGDKTDGRATRPGSPARKRAAKRRGGHVAAVPD